MARFRKIDSRIWNDEKFRSLSKEGQLVFMFFLTHPHMTSLGAMRANEAGLAHELGWTSKAFAKPFREVLGKGLSKYDERASFLGIPNFLKYNGPENPNVVKSWQKASDLIPECELKEQLLQSVSDYVTTLSRPFRKAFGSKPLTLSKPFRKQEPEPEPEPEQEQDSVPRRSKRPREYTDVPDAFEITPSLREWAEKNAPGVDLDALTSAFLDGHRSKGNRFKDWDAAWRTWVRNAVKWEGGRKQAKSGNSVSEHNARVMRELEAEENKSGDRPKAMAPGAGGRV